MEDYYTIQEAIQRMFGIDKGIFEEWFGKNIITKDGVSYVHKTVFDKVFQDHRTEILTKPVVKTYSANVKFN